VSAKVKVCENCETERGLNIVHRLEFLLSDRSGAADDFGGIAMQLAAGSWLLRERQSPWATAAIDEPFAQMDKSVRKAAAKQLLSLLGSTSYRQVFVISHSEDTTMMYPGRIEIFVREDGMRTIEVQ
jgi:ABC-type taurine transport system ATPase subunit